MYKYLIIGMGAFGKTLALKLMQTGNEVAVVDKSLDEIEAIQNEVTLAVCLDSTDEKALKTLGLIGYDVGIVCFSSSFENVLLTSVLLLQGGVQRVITRASDPMHIKILNVVGIDEIITPEIEVAERLAQKLMYRDNNLMELLNVDDNFSVAKFEAPSGFVGKTIGQLNLRAKYGVNVISVVSAEKQSGGKKGGRKKQTVESKVPGADTVINEKDILFVLGDTKNLSEVIKQ